MRRDPPGPLTSVIGYGLGRDSVVVVRDGRCGVGTTGPMGLARGVGPERSDHPQPVAEFVDATNESAKADLVGTATTVRDD